MDAISGNLAYLYAGRHLLIERLKTYCPFTYFSCTLLVTTCKRSLVKIDACLGFAIKGYVTAYGGGSNLISGAGIVSGEGGLYIRHLVSSRSNAAFISCLVIYVYYSHL